MSQSIEMFLRKYFWTLLSTLGILISGTISFFYISPYHSWFDIQKLSNRLSLLQTIWSFLGFWMAFIAVVIVIDKIKKKVSPILIFSDLRSGGLSLTTNTFPLKTKIPILVWNKGNITLLEKTMAYSMYFPKDIKILKIIPTVINEAGSEVIPKEMNHHSDTNLIVVGGDIPVNVYPQRKRRLFELDISISKPGRFTIGYFFVGDEGNFPTSIRFEANGSVFTGIGKLEIEVIKLG